MAWPVQGIFTSHWQSAGDKPAIDWSAVRAAGFLYAWIKATDFVDNQPITDPRFERDWQQAQAAGLLVGSVLYHRTRVSSSAQADYHLAVLSRIGYGQLPHLIDAEDPPDQSRPIDEDIRRLITNLQQSPLGRVALYSNPAYFRAHLPFLRPDDAISISIANWGRIKRAPDLPPNLTTWHDWQWTCAGNRRLYPAVPGIRGDVCLHRFNGSTSDFLAWINAAILPPPLFPLHLSETERAAILSLAAKLQSR